jgi:ABC-type lipoprotein export system ATPase subunit
MDNSNSQMIEVKELYKRYGSDRTAVIDGINLSVGKGEMVVLMGRSGCGKTTLLNLIAGLDRPNSGEISIDGTEITGMTENELAKFRLLNVGFIFQDYNLIADLTILENVALPLKLAGVRDLNRARKLLSILDIARLAEEDANTVSGGEAQRATIARAMANRPKVLLADEPTGNLDEENAINVMEYFKKVQKEFDTTILIATHDKELSEFGNRTISFDSIHAMRKKNSA